MTHIEAMKQALEAIYEYVELYGQTKKAKKAMPELRQAIAEESSATQEPVIFYRCKGCQHAYETEPPSSCDCMIGSGFEKIEYYTHPQPKAEQDHIPDATKMVEQEPKREPLTGKQIALIGEKWHFNLLDKVGLVELYEYTRAIEAAHGIKGEA